jgi:hypothetical protein
LERPGSRPAKAPSFTPLRVRPRVLAVMVSNAWQTLIGENVVLG